MTETIELGTQNPKRIPVVEQSHARLRIMLPRVFSSDELQTFREAFTKEEFAVSDATRLLLDGTNKAYDALLVLAPHVETAMPLHEFQGFGSAEALAQGDDAYDPAQDNAPGFDQILGAIETALRVNGMKRLGELLGTAKDVSSLIGGPASPPPSGRPTTPTSPA